ncbi:MAG: hypothetical protein ABSG02_16415 [Terriglobales bacterium]|jgi:hypothetical protein
MGKTKTLFEQIPVAVVKKTMEELERKQESNDKKLRVESSLPTSFSRHQLRCRTGVRK